MRDRWFLFACLLLLITTTTFAITDTNLVAYYKFDETSGNLLDQYGSNDGTNSNVTQNQTGLINKAYSYNGTNSYTQINNNLLPSALTPFTISAWIYPTDVSEERIIICDRFGSSGSAQYAYKYLFRVKDRKLEFIQHNGTTYSEVSSDSNLSINNWYYVAVTFKSGEVELFINGNSDKKDSSWVNKYPNHTNPTQIGRITGASTNAYFNGRIDEVGIWDRILTGQDINDLYNSGAGLTYPFIGISVDFNYVVRKDLNKILLTDTSNVSGVIETAWTWTNKGVTISTAQDYNLSATELTDYNICLHVDTNQSDINGDKCYAFNTGDWTAPTTTFSSFQVPNTTDQNITLTCTDNNSGCKTINYNINNEGWITPLTNVFSRDTTTYSSYSPSNFTKNWEYTVFPTTSYKRFNSITVSLRTSVSNSTAKAKLIYYYTDGTNEDSNTASTNSTNFVTFSFSLPNSNKDVNKIEYYQRAGANGGSQTNDRNISYDYLINPYSFLYSGAGDHNIQYYSTDNADNSETTKTSTFTTYGTGKFTFRDENTYASTSTNYTITPSINGISSGTGTTLDLNFQGITNQTYSFTFSKTGYGTRYYYTDLNQFSSFDFNQLLLQDTNQGDYINLIMYNTTGTTIQPNTPITITKNNYLIGRYLTNSSGEITPFLADLDTNYIFNVEGQYITSQRAVLIYRPKYDSNFADISGNWQITLTGPNSTNRYTITTNSQVVGILPNTETLYSAKICMLSGSVCSTSYFSRTYLLGFMGLVGETTIQPYLNLIADSTLRTLKVLNYTTNQPYPLAKIQITAKTDLGVTYTIESLYTDSTGTAGVYLTNGTTYNILANDLTSYTIVPNADTLTYYIYFNFLALPTETQTIPDINTSNDMNLQEFFVMRNTLFNSCTGTNDCFPSALIAIILTMIILIVATAATVGNFVGIKGLSLIAFICFTIFFGIGWLPIYIFAFLGSITLLLLVIVQ